jgi:ArsR family transcriptional regulator
MPPTEISDEFDILFHLLGNRTRYEILRHLAREPMFLGQLSRELEIGQQAILRHLRELIKQGLLETYEAESIRGPPRKYYKLGKCIRLSIRISPEGIYVISTVPDTAQPRSIEELLRRNYPELSRLLARVQLLPRIKNKENRRLASLELLQQLKRKRREVRSIAEYLSQVIKWVQEKQQ